MVVTVLEAHVDAEKAALLEEEYRRGIERLDEGISQTFLLRSMKDASLWQILTVWQSREALEAMRRTGETPRGVLMFRAAEAEPMLSVFDLQAHGVAWEVGGPMRKGS
jgi:hypothetical protein